MTKAQFEPLQPPVEGGVVVGYDGSPEALHAVEAAADEALRRGATLHVVRAWMLSNAAAETDALPGAVPSLPEVEAAVRASVDRAVAAAQRGRPGLRVVGHVVHGRAAHTLAKAGERAELVVVSRRGSGGVVDRLLGSTTDQLVRQVPCAVLVVRPPDGAGRQQSSPPQPTE